MSCTGTPISWLRLERYHAGELDADEREAIAAHLASCDACASCLKEIEADARELPPLPKPARVVSLRRAAPVIAMLAAAAAILFVVGRTPRPDPERVKGSDIAFALVRDDETVVGEAGTGVYRDGDRFKAVVTCPPGMHGGFDLVVYENGAASFPLEPRAGLACGNAIALPGAFRVTGRERMIVCLVWSDGGAIDRDVVRRTPPEALPHAQCKALSPAP
jgi:hypothetical protein